MSTKSTNVTSVSDLIAMPPEERVKIIRAKNKETRGDWIILLFSILEDAHLRAKDAEEESQSLQSALEKSQADYELLRQLNYGQEETIQELHDEVDRLARGYNAQKDLRTIALAEANLMVELAYLGFPIVEEEEINPDDE